LTAEKPAKVHEKPARDQEKAERKPAGVMTHRKM
jgi:hypothetical protein